MMFTIVIRRTDGMEEFIEAERVIRKDRGKGPVHINMPGEATMDIYPCGFEKIYVMNDIGKTVGFFDGDKKKAV